MNETEAGRIAAAVNQLRPDWPTTSLRTLLARPELANRPRRDVAVALTWVACESATKTPARVLESGPWWHQTADSTPRRHEPYNENETCSVCSYRQPECRRRWADDHEFLSVARARSIPSVKRPAELTAELARRPPVTPTPTLTEAAASAQAADTARARAARDTIEEDA